MKTLLTVVAISMSALGTAWADDAHHPEKAPVVVAPAPDKAIQQMRDNTVTMQSQLDALAAAKTVEERQKVLMAHMETMRENMLLGQQVSQGGAMNCGMMGSMEKMHGGRAVAAPVESDSSPQAMNNRMHQMERRMDMMQMMMERMAKPSRRATRG